jgi:hypothetical protein
VAESGTVREAPLWGVSAEFATPGAMVEAIRSLRDRGFGRLDAYSPVPVPGAAEALRLPAQPIHPFALVGVIAGGGAMMAMCLYATAYDYVFNIGGRPRFSWPAFVVPSFSFAMLAGALAVVTAFLVLNRLPRLNHPAFNIPDFGRATQDRFFLAVEARDERFDPDAVERALGQLLQPPLRVSRVPR